MSRLIDAGKTWEGRAVDGKFPLLQCLGSAQRSAVFLTERSEDGSKKTAAIKLISAEVFSAGNLDAGAQLFRWSETAKLSHPHLIRLFENGRCRMDGAEFLYVVMEYADENLAQIIPQRALSPAEVQEMLPPAVEALAFLHQAGLAHGHVKPSNVMAVNNQLKLSSDGIRKVGEPGKQEASPYLAPEAASTGSSPAADAWSLGVLLVAIMTQHEPPAIAAGSRAKVPYKIPQPYFGMAQLCLRHDPKERCTMKEILGTPRVQQASTKSAPGKSRTVADGKVWLVLPLLAAIVLLAFLFARKSHDLPTSSGKATESALAEQTPAPFTKQTNSATGRNDRGKVLQQVLPEVSRNAQNTITGHIKVRVDVSVDANGAVSHAELVSAGPSKYFANQALLAARRWKFTPPQVDGQASSSEWVLRFEFGRKETQVFPSEIKP